MKEKYIPIKDWSEDERPREKLISKSPQALSDAELLAILIGSGSRNESAVDLSKRILGSVDHQLHQLARKNSKELMRFNGIGEAKAITIIAAMELGKRKSFSEVPTKQSIQSSKQAFDLIAPNLNDLDHEEFWVLLLNRSNKLIARERISQGGIHGTVVDPKVVFKKAIDHKACAMILAHNHPSGNLNPSQQDKDLTNKIKSGASLMDISVFDHIIVGEKSYYSFADNNLI